MAVVGCSVTVFPLDPPEPGPADHDPFPFELWPAEPKSSISTISVSDAALNLKWTGAYGRGSRSDSEPEPHERDDNLILYLYVVNFSVVLVASRLRAAAVRGRACTRNSTGRSVVRWSTRRCLSINVHHDAVLACSRTPTDAIAHSRSSLVLVCVLRTI